MMYDKLKVVFAVVSPVLFALALALAIADKNERRRCEAEARESVEWACWCDEWADTRAAQERYLRERGGR